MDVANALQQLAVRYGIRRDVGVDGSRVHNWETGKSNPGNLYVWLLCRHFDKSDAELDLTEDWDWPGDPRLFDVPVTEKADSPSAPPGVIIREATSANEPTVAIPLRGPHGIVTYMISRRAFLGLMSVAGITPLAIVTEPDGTIVDQTSFPPTPAWASAVRQAVLDPKSVQTSHSDGYADLTALGHEIRTATRMSFASDHTHLGALLPSLISSAESIVGDTSDDGQACLRLLADIYAVAGWTLIKGNDPMFAVVAAERSLAAARRAHDPLRISAATRCLAESHMRDGRYDVASRVALTASLPVETTSEQDKPKALTLRGAALLSAAAAAARRHDNREALDALAAASVYAAQLDQDRSDLGTVFGPTNVAIHRVAIAIELGNAQEALRRSTEVNLTPLPADLRERRARFLIDVARAHAQLKQDADAVHVLQAAEATAADETRSHRLTHVVLRQLLSRGRGVPKYELRTLADRCGIVH